MQCWHISKAIGMFPLGSSQLYTQLYGIYTAFNRVIELIGEADAKRR